MFYFYHTGGSHRDRLLQAAELEPPWKGQPAHFGQGGNRLTRDSGFLGRRRRRSKGRPFHRASNVAGAESLVKDKSSWQSLHLPELGGVPRKANPFVPCAAHRWPSEHHLLPAAERKGLLGETHNGPLICRTGDKAGWGSGLDPTGRLSFKPTFSYRRRDPALPVTTRF